MCLHKIQRKDNPVYLVIEQLIYGTAEDDVILGYCDSRNDAFEIAKELEEKNTGVHYEIREISKLW